MNRIDGTIVFNKSNKDDIKKIVDLQIKELEVRLKEKEITLDITERAVDELVEEGYDPVFVAKPLKRPIQKSLYNGIAVKLLKGEFLEKDRIKVDYDDKNKEFIFTRKNRS